MAARASIQAKQALDAGAFASLGLQFFELTQLNRHWGSSMLQDYVDSLAKKGPITVPDFTTYQPGVTQRMAPAEQSSALPLAAPKSETAAVLLPPSFPPTASD